MTRHMLHSLSPTRSRIVISAVAFGVLALLCVLGIFGLSEFALAQQQALQELGTTAGLPQENIGIIIARIIRAFLGVIGIILVLLILYAGFLYMTAAGEVEKTKKAKQIIQQAVIGVVIIFSAFSITQFILSRLLAAAGLSGNIRSEIAAQYSEPLSGSLGAGAIRDHYPPRNALDIPRNTRIMVTFKEAVDPAGIIAADGSLNTDNVMIFPTREGEAAALTTSEVTAAATADGLTFSFDPVDFLGSPTEDVNYTVTLGPGIRSAGNRPVFTGAYASGYAWSFEVSTEVDMTPPTVRSVLPVPSTNPYARNITVEITFSEAMDPVVATGVYDPPASTFNNIVVSRLGAGAEPVRGAFEISNGYRTVSFTPREACGEDPCGDTIFCLPQDAQLSVEAHAASIGAEPPQAVLITGGFNGLVDAASNSLDGNADGIPQGSAEDNSEAPDEKDDYVWTFETSGTINNEVPQITDIAPGILEGDAAADLPVEITFSTPMKSSTLTSQNIQLWPDPWYEFWFSVTSEPVQVGGKDVSRAFIDHPTMVGPEDLGWDYYPLVSEGVKSAYQICMYPALGPGAAGAASCGTSFDLPYCCNGSPSPNACSSVSGAVLPDTSQ